MFEVEGTMFKPTTRGAAERLAEVSKLIEQNGYVPVQLCPYNSIEIPDVYFDDQHRWVKPPQHVFWCESPLHYAATLKNEKLAKQMINLILSGVGSVECAQLVDTKDRLLATPLDVAVYYNHSATVRTLLKYHAQVRPKTFVLLLHHESHGTDDHYTKTVCRIFNSLIDAGASLQGCDIDLGKALWT